MANFELLKEHLASLFNLSAEEANIFLSKFHRTQLRRDEVFVEEGKICNKIGLIEKGLMKCIYNNKGRETVFEFAFENNFISDYYSFVTNTPAEKEIRCLEDTTVYVASREDLERVGREHSFIGRMSREMNERLFLRMHHRLKSMLLDSAVERYQKLLAERQDLVQRIPQYLIASYLNVTPETISRIRRKISSS